MDMNRIIALYMDDCHSRQLRPKTMQSYEQALKLFATWLEETLQINQVEQVKDMHIRSYINDLQTRGKYTFCVNRQSEAYNHPTHRRDYQDKISNITINNYLRNLRAFFKWLVEVEYIDRSPIQKVRLLPDERSAREYLEDDEVMSEAFLQMAGVFSQLELAMIRARVKSGMANAKAKGKQIGRRPTTKEDIPSSFLKHYAIFMEGKMNVSELERVCGLSRPTVYKYMKMMG